ncbi:MAG: hypothetical protein H0X34_17295 [Chthoniobacterales bacterium]|nr:hypothetical protein [Chthoniobacterales bacterium]
MIKIQNNGSGLSWPDHNFELKSGKSEVDEKNVAAPILERLKQMHDEKQIVLEIPGMKHMNGQWVAAEDTPDTIEHAPTQASPDVSTTGKDGSAQGARMADDKNVAGPGKPVEKR